ncbi:MAG: hypothetical protein WDN06_17300 [Asticcacaulis sp.]
MAICMAFHALVTQYLGERRVTRDIDLVRDAHRLMVDAIDSTQKDMIELADRVQNTRTTRSEELTSEVRMLEDLVKKLGMSIETGWPNGRPARRWCRSTARRRRTPRRPRPWR